MEYYGVVPSFIMLSLRQNAVDWSSSRQTYAWLINVTSRYHYISLVDITYATAASTLRRSLSAWRCYANSMAAVYLPSATVNYQWLLRALLRHCFGHGIEYHYLRRHGEHVVGA